MSNPVSNSAQSSVPASSVDFNKAFGIISNFLGDLSKVCETFAIYASKDASVVCKDLNNFDPHLNPIGKDDSGREKYRVISNEFPDYSYAFSIESCNGDRCKVNQWME